MVVLSSTVQPASDSFKENRSSMFELIDHWRSLEQRTIDASNKRLKTFRARGQLSPRERLERLLDPGMPFLQMHSMANYCVENPDRETSVPGASVIVGVGFVEGIRCMIWVDDSGISAGAATESTGFVSTSILEMCMRQKLPVIHLVESAGANLLKYKVELWSRFGNVFRDLARLSAAGIPTMVVLHGGSTAGGAYMPGMSDYVIGVKENGMAALGGAALVKAATGEEADDRELGGTEMHSSVSGVVEYLVEDDAHGILKAREVMKSIDWNKRVTTVGRRPYEPPRFPAEELAGAIPVDPKVPYDFREVLARLVDDSSVEEFKSRYGVSTVCGYASITGISFGFIGNNGPIDPNGATKAAQFIQLCDAADMPILFFNNTTGYMVGTEYEQAGMIKHGSKMIQAVSNARVPKISLYIGASFGAGNYGMCGWAYQPDFLFAWPNARTGVMAGQSAADTMSEVARVGAARKGQEVPEEMLEQQAAAIRAHFDAQEDAFYTSGRVLDHGIIDPRDTRKVLAFCLETVLEARLRETRPNAFGVARM
ncbi:MAG: carboxyl transferase domain-containing protein [Pseudomonadota bacterium]|nr:carboxyl transferase domain-containing protein [Pseudomonadota bacterium]